MPLQQGDRVMVLMRYEFGGCIGKYIGAEGDKAYIDLPVQYAHGVQWYDHEVPLKALAQLPYPKGGRSDAQDRR